METVEELLDLAQRQLVTWDADLSRRMGMTQAAVNHWRTGHRPIPVARAVELEAMTGIPDLARRFVEAAARQRLRAYLEALASTS